MVNFFFINNEQLMNKVKRNQQCYTFFNTKIKKNRKRKSSRKIKWKFNLLLNIKNRSCQQLINEKYFLVFFFLFHVRQRCFLFLLNLDLKKMVFWKRKLYYQPMKNGFLNYFYLKTTFIFFWLLLIFNLSLMFCFHSMFIFSDQCSMLWDAKNRRKVIQKYKWRKEESIFYFYFKFDW